MRRPSRSRQERCRKSPTYRRYDLDAEEHKGRLPRWASPRLLSSVAPRTFRRGRADEPDRTRRAPSYRPLETTRVEVVRDHPSKIGRELHTHAHARVVPLGGAEVEVLSTPRE